jgi:beta-galactosidase
MHASWSSTHEETWDVVKHNAFVGGQYIWTGFDYIGEPTPYGFPARSSYFGIIDLAGFPKDSYYMYQSEWTSQPMLHLFPHWNWLSGQTIDLWAYYNQADEVELFINGQSRGVRRKSSGDPLCTEYHVGWRVVFEPGEIRVVSRKDGREVCSQTIRTASAPASIRLTKDYVGQNTTFIAVEVIDKDGNLCPLAEDQITFTVTDGAQILGTDNGCQTDMTRFTSPQRKAFFGKCMVVVRGKGTLKAQSPMLSACEISL